MSDLGRRSIHRLPSAGVWYRWFEDWTERRGRGSIYGTEKRSEDRAIDSMTVTQGEKWRIWFGRDGQKAGRTQRGGQWEGRIGVSV